MPCRWSRRTHDRPLARCSRSIRSPSAMNSSTVSGAAARIQFKTAMLALPASIYMRCISDLTPRDNIQSLHRTRTLQTDDTSFAPRRRKSPSPSLVRHRSDLIDLPLKTVTIQDGPTPRPHGCAHPPSSRILPRGREHHAAEVTLSYSVSHSTVRVTVFDRSALLSFSPLLYVKHSSSACAVVSHSSVK